MFDPGLYFKTLDFNYFKVLPKLGLESFVIWSIDKAVKKSREVLPKVNIKRLRAITLQEAKEKCPTLL